VIHWTRSIATMMSFKVNSGQIFLWNITQYTKCNRRNGPDLGRVFLRSNYADITQKTYIQSWTVTEILAREVWNFDSYHQGLVAAWLSGGIQMFLLVQPKTEGVPPSWAVSIHFSTTVFIGAPHIQSVTGGMDQTSGECSLGHTMPI